MLKKPRLKKPECESINCSFRLFPLKSFGHFLQNKNAFFRRLIVLLPKKPPKGLPWAVLG